MKKITLFIIYILAVTIVFAQTQRVKYNFNSDWKVMVSNAKNTDLDIFSDAAWKSVTLPYAWNEDDAFKKDIADLTTGIAWYCKHFKIPASAKGQNIFLEFEGLRQAGEFYLNGKSLASVRMV